MRITCPGPFDPTTRRASSPWRAVKPLVASAVLAFGGTSWGADISEIYAEAVENDPVLAGQRASAAARELGVTIARSSLLPQANANVSRSTNSNRTDAIDMNPSSPNFGRPTPETNSTSQSWGGNVSQSVLNLGNWFNYRGAKERAKQSDWDLENTAQLLITRVAGAYLNVLTRQASLESAVAAEEAVRRQLEQVQQRFDVGLEAITGVLESKAAYDRAEETRIQAESDLWISFEALRTLTGIAYTEIDRLAANLPIIDPQPNDEDAWVNTAMSTNFRIRSRQNALRAAEHDLRAQMSAHLPTISASANYGNSSGQQSYGGVLLPDRGTTTYSSFSLNFSMPLFTGLRVQAGVKQARLNREQARQALIGEELTVAEEVRTRFRSVVTDVVRVAARSEAIKSAEAALEATQTGYEVGTRNIVDVLLAQQNLFSAQFNYEQSRHNYVLNMLRLRESAGTLSEADIAALNSHMDPGSPVQKWQREEN